jgi:CheY-like chemotaxis protein/HPt (histidine-containing phosphotransfer) domain-containing protein
MMPEMDGFTLAQQIKNDPSLADATIMMLSSAGSPGDAARCKELGIAAYLTKPIRQSDLLDSIMVTLGKSGATSADKGLVTRHNIDGEDCCLRVLLTEDNPVNQKVACRILEQKGHQVTCANNGQEALDALQREGDDAFDLVFMDIQMPVMGGFEATAAIRQLEQEAETRIPIIAMTAHAMKGDRDRCIQAGMDDYISKPLQADALHALLKRWAAKCARSSTEEKSSEKTARPSASEQKSENTQADAGDASIPPVNVEKAIEYMGGDWELFREAIDLFLQNVPEKLDKLNRECRGDPEQLATVAHALKGASSTMAADPLREAALRLEQIGRNGELALVDQALQDLEKHWQQVQEFFHNMDIDQESSDSPEQTVSGRL